VELVVQGVLVVTHQQVRALEEQVALVAQPERVAQLMPVVLLQTM
jgi:hypothetical protein